MLSKIVLPLCLLVGAATAIALPAGLAEGVIVARTAAVEQPSNLIEAQDSFPTTTQLLRREAVASSTAAPSPTQPGLISTCNAYYLVQRGDYCATVVSKFGNFTLSEFYTWNPAVKSDCSELLAGYYVCVGILDTAPSPIACPTGAFGLQARAEAAPIPTQTGIASNCNSYYEVVPGDMCVGIATHYAITLSQFYSWNPAVGTNCQFLLAGYYVCVGVPGTTTTTNPSSCTSTTPSTTNVTTTPAPVPTQPGIASDCIQYYEARSGDTCISIVQKYSSYLTLSEFETWNPAVGNDCTKLLTGYYYCVATKSVHV